MIYVLGVVLLVRAAVVARPLWRWRPRRRREPGFPFVYVEIDGTVRELSPGEQSYLTMEFDPADGARPYIKWYYEELNEWGVINGFLKRRQVPRDIPILPVHPDYDARVAELKADPLRIHKAAGEIITRNEDGIVTISVNPDVEPEEGLERARQVFLEDCHIRAKLAKADDSSH